MPIANGQMMMPGFTRIVNYDPLPNVGYGKAEVKEEPRDGQASTEVVVITNIPQGGTLLNVGDRFTIMTPAPSALQVRIECLLLLENCII